MSDTDLQDQAFADEGATAEGVRTEGSDAAGQAVDTAEDLRRKIDALDDQLLRTKAEHQNVLRRAGLERTEAVRFANADIMRAIIPVLDDLDRAIEAASSKDKASADRALLDGVKLVRENLLKALREQGLEIIESTGRPFDPHVHEAMMQQPSDEHPAGNVAAELAKGYRLRERTLRPAKVVVSKGSGS